MAVALIAFLLGWFASQESLGGDVTGAVTAVGTPPELLSPSDHLKEDQIAVFEDKIIIYLDNVSWARLTDTNSMDPILDKWANTLEIKPASPENINPGDIVSYRHVNDTLIHRVIKTGHDDLGWYCLVKGDNADDPPASIRFEEINGLVVGILY